MTAVYRERTAAGDANARDGNDEDLISSEPWLW